MEVVPFDEWLELNPEVVESACPLCHGKGTIPHDCDCDHCTRAEDGEEDECPECDGGRSQVVLEKQYRKAVETEKEKLARWLAMAGIGA